ncbi:hypothetical protein ABT340_39575 [Streptosporangium sp. NPDC000239]|uniref:hypothetical protein n=1 Tax=Streptosporangium sp. NPDC000239 TaxID=3154248 RepID=UPI00332D5FAA
MERQRCSAKSKRSGEQCQNKAIPGAKTCRMHGSATKKAKNAAERRVGEDLARRTVDTYGLPREVDPATALLEEVHRTAGHVAWLAEVVAGFEREDLVWGVVEEVEKTATEFTGTDVTRKSVPNVWLDLYQRERKHLTDVCKAAIAAGIAERQVRLAEQQGALIASVIGRILDDLDLSATQRARVGEVVPRHLRAVAG